MRLTYLEIVQQILSELESDEVDTLLETVESTQITNMVKMVYYHIIEGRPWPHLWRLFTLEANAAGPTILSIPENVDNLNWIKYNWIKDGETRNRFSLIHKVDPSTFMSRVNSRDNDEAFVDVTTVNGITYHVFNDRQPTFWTSVDDQTVIFDAYDSDIEASLDPDKTQCYGYINPVVTISDDFIFDLPTESFSYLLSECLSFAFATYKQLPNTKIEQMAQTQRRKQAWKNAVIPATIQYPDYGKRRK
jgi:hypothetical protein